MQTEWFADDAVWVFFVPDMPSGIDLAPCRPFFATWSLIGSVAIPAVDDSAKEEA